MCGGFTGSCDCDAQPWGARRKGVKHPTATVSRQPTLRLKDVASERLAQAVSKPVEGLEQEHPCEILTSTSSWLNCAFSLFSDSSLSRVETGVQGEIGLARSTASEDNAFSETNAGFECMQGVLPPVPVPFFINGYRYLLSE